MPGIGSQFYYTYNTVVVLGHKTCWVGSVQDDEKRYCTIDAFSYY